MWLEQLLSHNIIRPIDAEFARFMMSGDGPEDQALGLLVTLLSVELGRKNVCLALSQLDLHAPLGPLPEEIQLPDLRPIMHCLEQHVCVAKDHHDQLTPSKPLVLYRSRLYLQRYWYYEATVAKILIAKMAQVTPIDEPFAAKMLDELFGRQAEVDWQKVACTMALLKNFAVITGGPGTGKTTTVTKLLALLISQHLKTHNGQRPVIKLVTPTGKAAARLSESIKGAKARLPIDAEILQMLPDVASTVHRLLGVRPNSSSFKHNRDNPLHLDVLVVDEVSMVDLPMMAKLLEALPENAKIVLLGDKDQLSSVEAGSVLADICGDTATSLSFSNKMGADIAKLAQVTIPDGQITGQSLADCICMLHKSHRFDDKSGIGQLAKAVNRGDIAGVGHLDRMQVAQLMFRDVSSNDFEYLINHSAHAYQPYLQMVIDRADPKAIIETFNRYQVLCAVREGEFGVVGLNQAIEKRLAQMGLIDPKQLYYAGRPIMISKNDYSLQLYNGDVGVILPDQASGHLKAWFINVDGDVRSVYPNRLPSHEAVYAMTVHKSQGSEFDEVSFVLPPMSQAFGNKVISTELVYTGITRAKKQFNLFAQSAVMNMALAQRTKRNSGLGDLLYRSCTFKGEKKANRG